MPFTPINYMDEMIDRVVAMCQEAVPEARGTLNYLLGDYANFPHWRVGETEYDFNIDSADFVLVAHQVVARLYGGKIDSSYKGDVERSLRPFAGNAMQFFASNLRLTSSVTSPSDYTTGMRYLAPGGTQLLRPVKTIREEDEGKLMFVQFTWNITFQFPRKVR